MRPSASAKSLQVPSAGRGAVRPLVPFDLFALSSFKARERVESEPVIEAEGDSLGEVVSGGGRDVIGGFQRQHVGQLGGDAAADGEIVALGEQAADQEGSTADGNRAGWRLVSLLGDDPRAVLEIGDRAVCIGQGTAADQRIDDGQLRNAAAHRFRSKSGLSGGGMQDDIAIAL